MSRLTIREATLLITSECSYCPAVLDALTRLLKQGQIDRLEVFNLTRQPEIAARFGARSVPWMRIGPFDLTGRQSYTDLVRWLGLADSDDATEQYYSHLLSSQQAARVIQLTDQQPETLLALTRLLGRPETPMSVRLGIGVVLETLAETGYADALVESLAELTRSATQQIRADACHYLGLAGTPLAARSIQPLLQDTDAEVREIAAESLDAINGSPDTRNL